MNTTDPAQHRLGTVLVACQFMLIAALAALALPAFVAGEAPAGAWLMAIAGALLGLWALSSNRPGNFNIRPTPREGGQLVQQGPYMRNPPGSAHAPFSREGCLLFVKLRQFAPGDLESVRIPTRATPWRAGLVPGLSVMALHSHDGIDTALVRWAPNTRFNAHSHPGGEEILVLDGIFSDEGGDYEAGTWLRSPRWSRHTPFTGPEGALIYVKVGHHGAEFLGS